MKAPKKHRSLCQHEFCEEPADKARKSGLCVAHAREWINSPEWREAMADEDIRSWMGLRMEKTAMRLVGKYKRKWLKRLTSEPAQEEGT